MGSNRFNQPQKVVPNYQPKTPKMKEEEFKLNFKPCIVCGATIHTGYHARWGDGGTCSGKCESIQELAITNFGDKHENTTRVTAFNGPVFRPR